MERYYVRTFGCQMNKHDSERIAGLLAAEGLARASEPSEADVVVFNTCCVRAGAEERLRGQVASLRALKDVRPHVLIAIGGCVAQKEGDRLVRDLPHVDVVFGTDEIAALPDLLERARTTGRAAVDVGTDDRAFASDLPAERDKRWHAWLPITVGCDNHCSYCIVPSVRGPERSRRFDSVVDEARRLVADGVVEITLLGQNVNSYGRDLYGGPRFAEMLRAVAATGVRRVRFATSHPKDLTEETIEAIRDVSEVCPSLHLPVQSGSSRILRRMARGYTKEHYLTLIDRLYQEIPGIALSTDVIVGFPGETDEDFADTMDVIRRARFDQAFTFLFSPREGTAAAQMGDTVEREVAQARFDRLVEQVNASATAKNEPFVGSVQRVLLEGASKRDASMLLGRTETNKVVHAPCPEGGEPGDLAGTFVEIEIESAHTWFLAGRLRA
jgi:tRNA-2-methylthio-N6-dimethylallyladenosine synthase